MNRWISTRDSQCHPEVGQKVLLGFSKSYEKGKGRRGFRKLYDYDEDGHELRGRVLKAECIAFNAFSFSLYGEDDLVGDEIVSGDDEGLYWQPLPEPPQEVQK